MRKRDILLTEPVKANKKGKIITAQIVNDVLVLNCYKDKKLFARYCMAQNGQYEGWTEGKWVRQKLMLLVGYEWWSSTTFKKEVKLDSDKDKKVIDSFFGKACGDYFKEVEYSEDHYNYKKRDDAYTRKVKRIDDLMDMVPVLPNDFEEWCSHVIFKNAEFMFYDKEKDTYFCTACGHEHKADNLKHNKIYECSQSQKKVIIKRRQKEIMIRDHCMVIQVMDDKRSVARHFMVEKIWNSSGSKFEAYEDIRIILYKNDLPFLRTGKVDIYYGQLYQADEFAQDWWTTKNNKNFYTEYCYPGTCKEALKNTVYENLNIPLMAEKGWKLHYNKMMINYNICDFMEYMVKGNFERLTSEASVNLYWGSFSGCMDIHGTTIQEVLGIDMQRVHRLRQNNGGMQYLKWLQWEKENRSLPEETIKWLEDKNIHPYDIKFITDKMSPIKVANYLKRQQKESKKSIPNLLRTWEDYLSMAARMKMDINNELVYRPKNLKESHDELVIFIEKNNAAIKAGEILSKYPLVNDICTEIKAKYEFKDDVYTIMVPNGIEDIIMEGKILQHCMDKTERYFERINQRETYILFLRKTDDVDRPYYTLEIEPNGTVRQKRTLGDNQNPDIEDAKIFLSKWQKEVQKRITEDDKKLAEESRKLRIDGYRELREKNTKVWNGVHAGELLADILEADLMEVG